MKIDWSGRSHYFSKNDINYFSKVIKTADPLAELSKKIWLVFKSI